MSSTLKNAGGLEARFGAALDSVIEQVKQDRSILAAFLCGSLSHDRVWDKSDIDLVLITIDDRKAPEGGVALYADGVNVHALLMQRTAFRAMAESALSNSFMHSFLAKGRLLYTHDPSIEELAERVRHIGARDTQVMLLAAGCHALPSLYKAHKFLRTRADLDYTALWILYAATPLAQIEVVSRGLIADREVIPQALALNPVLFTTIYTELLNAPKTRASVERALGAVDAHMAANARRLFSLVLDYLEEAGEARSATEIERHFAKNFGIEGVTTVCEYLSDQGLAGKASLPIQLTRRSNVSLEELAFYHIESDGASA